MDQAIADVTNPASTGFRHYLTPAQFNARYAPSHGDVLAVQRWLQDGGFKLLDTPSNNHYVEAEGTAAQVEAALSTTMNLYKVNGVTVRSNASAPQVPASLNGIVSDVVGLDEGATFVHRDIARDPNALPGPEVVQPGPCSKDFGDTTKTSLPNPYQPGQPIPYVVCGYSASQMESAYGVAPLIKSGNDGGGEKIAIIDAYASPTAQTDLDAYSDANGLPRTHIQQDVAPGTFNHPESGGKNKQDPQGWYTEEALDVESAHAMAPGATLVYVGAPNNFQDLDAAMNEVVSRHLASIVSNSYGFATELLPPGFINSFHSTLQEGALTGVAIYFSSGDCGDEGPSTLACGGSGTVGPDWPAIDPDVTAVGGSSVEIVGGAIQQENGWGTHTTRWNGTAWSPAPPGPFQYGAGGGVSRLFAQPAYQSGTVPAAIATKNGGPPMRAIPDVAMDADPQTGFQILITRQRPDGSIGITPQRFGGTSLASPLFAGVMALRDQRIGGQGAGFSNPTFYANPGAFRDVLPGLQYVLCNVPGPGGVLIPSLRITDHDTSLDTTPGWDLDTGLGTATAATVALA
jgi:subtilase family serine protease